jgi:hypothetical protein
LFIETLENFSGVSSLNKKNLYICCTNKHVMSKEDKVIVSIKDTDEGLEVRINEGAYGNLAIVGLLEKIKMSIMTETPEESSRVKIPMPKSGNHA